MAAGDEEEEEEEGGWLSVRSLATSPCKVTRNSWLSAVFTAGYLGTGASALYACVLPSAFRRSPAQ